MLIAYNYAVNKCTLRSAMTFIKTQNQCMTLKGPVIAWCLVLANAPGWGPIIIVYFYKL